MIIVAASQFLIYWVYIMPMVEVSEMILSGSLWWMFIIDTILIAAAGYVINDIYDQASDQHNKPDKIFIGGHGLRPKEAWIYYWALVTVGLCVAGYIAFQIDKMHLLIIYPVAVGLLFLYSKSFKKLPLIGNLAVAMFCAFVPGVILYAEWDFISQLKRAEPAVWESTIGMFIAYILFAFLSTMLREIVKDIEDVEGDRLAGYHTLPIWSTQKMAKNTALFFGVLLILSYALWVLPYYATEMIYLFTPFAGFMLLFTIIILYLLMKANEKHHYAQISKWIKMLMIVSLFIFLCVPFLKQLV